jgi:hypothetical protein
MLPLYEGVSGGEYKARTPACCKSARVSWEMNAEPLSIFSTRGAPWRANNHRSAHTNTFADSP